uniref:EF-hand domain-containing protein n=1 Tax=Zooxanthella nutricula TaxID=1333877 RepID=A0A6V0FSN5_9DINO
MASPPAPPAGQSFAEAYTSRRRADGEGFGYVGTSRLLPTSPWRSATTRMVWAETPQHNTEAQQRPLALLSNLASNIQKATGYSDAPKAGYGNIQAFSHRGDYGYHLIRSDVEDEEFEHLAGKALPGMPTHDIGVRRRTLNAFEFGGEVDSEASAGSMAWVSSSWFQWVCGIMIGSNAIVVGLELEIDTPVWFWVEQVLLAFFCFELAARMKLHGRNFFTHDEDWGWNVFDFSVVVLGLFDQWVVPLGERVGVLRASDGKHGGPMQYFYMTIHICRLLRIVRLLRLVRIVPPLHELSGGVIEALAGMFWVLVFVVMTLYSVAILCTRMIGHGDILSDDMAVDPEIREIQVMFASVPESMFTLFGTISSWSLTTYVPLFVTVPILKPVFVLFYVYSAWALLAVMTGVVSENMIAIREQLNKEDAQREEMRKTLITNMLIELFDEADVDKDGTVSKAEFEAMLGSPTIMKKMKKNSNLKMQDLQDLFHWLDHDGGGSITIDEFMTGFKWVNEPLRTKSLVKLQERIAQDLFNLHHSLREGLQSRAEYLTKLVQVPLRKVHAIAEQMQTLAVNFHGVRAAMRDQIANAPAPQEISDATFRLESKLDDALQMLQALSLDAGRIRRS